MTAPLVKRSASITEAGRRPVNQDAVLAVTLGDGAELVAVADGMGGHVAGEVASTRALDALRAAVEAGADLVAAVHAANAAVLEESRARPECRGMGTTLVASLRRGDHYTVANVGDSRAYRIDESGIHQITMDHSFVAEAVRSGQLTRKQAETSRWRNAVTRVIGTDEDVDVDFFGPFDANEPHTLVLCSDGLYRGVEPETLLRGARNGAPPADAARHLVTAALDGGSDDNISIAIVRFGAADSAVQPPPPTRAEPAADAVQPTAPADIIRARPAADAPRATPGRRRSRRHRQHSRWTATEIWIIFGGIVLVILYVAMLRLMF